MARRVNVTRHLYFPDEVWVCNHCYYKQLPSTPCFLIGTAKFCYECMRELRLLRLFPNYRRVIAKQIIGEEV